MTSNNNSFIARCSHCHSLLRIPDKDKVSVLCPKCKFKFKIYTIQPVQEEVKQVTEG